MYKNSPEKQLPIFPPKYEETLYQSEGTERETPEVR